MPLDQSVPVEPLSYTTLHILAASHNGESVGKIKLNYQDGTSEDIRLASQPWWRWPYLPSGDIIFPHNSQGASTNFNQTNIFQSSHYVDFRRKLVSVTLTKAYNENLHIFAMSVSPMTVVPADRAVLRIESARATETWPEGLKSTTRIIRVAVTNIGSMPIVRKQKARVSIKAPGLGRIKGYGHIRRLMPGERTTVDVAMVVVNEADTQKSINAEVVVSGDNVVGTNYQFQMNLLVREYTGELSLYSHESPGWFKEAKFGVLFTWGLYSIPSWGNTGLAGTEAEW
jgi:alpha-L-fucosidase